MLFKDLNVIDKIKKAVDDMGYKEATPIQEKSIPFLLEGKDFLGCAQTGTGKTAAFAIPVLQNIEINKKAEEKRSIKALILAPTRELAIQIDENFIAYSKYLDIKTTVIFGGVSQKPQERKIRAGVDILVATPGRLLDLMGQGIIKLNDVEYFVLDEADRMFDMGMIHDVKRIISKLKKDRQNILFSATMPKEVMHLVNNLLKNPEKVEVAPVSSTVDTVKQGLYHVLRKEKKDLLNHIVKNEDIKSLLVFTKTKHRANTVVKNLDKIGVLSAAIHGNKSQNARQLALSNFKEGKIKVLVATDIAARGIDVDELSHVINYDLPDVPETYVHRIGRTGRAGNTGVSISFCDEEEKKELRDIEKVIGRKIPLLEEVEFERTVEEKPVKREEKPKSNSRSGRGYYGSKNNNGSRNNNGSSRKPGDSSRKRTGNNNGSKRREQGK